MKQYSIATGYLDEKKEAMVNNDLRHVSAALAMDHPVFPEAYQNDPGVRKYLKARFGKPDVTIKSIGDWVGAYSTDIRSACSEQHAAQSLAYLKKLDKDVRGIEKATTDQLSSYLAKIGLRKSKATRNRIHNTFSRFYNWAVATKRMRENPLALIKRVAEERSSEIIYCTPEEREELIVLARETGWMEWLAVPVAFFTGIRREEIANLKWAHIRFVEGTILVAKTKTKTSRTLPLNTQMEALLSQVPEPRRKGYVVPVEKKVERLSRFDSLLARIRTMKRERLVRESGLEPVPPSKSKEYREYRRQLRKLMKEESGGFAAHRERIGWNPFRHTFGSLLAQAGVSLDKISAWMGNTPEVCRRHYAQFIPRDRRDNEIDKL